MNLCRKSLWCSLSPSVPRTSGSRDNLVKPVIKLADFIKTFPKSRNAYIEVRTEKNKGEMEYKFNKEKYKGRVLTLLVLIKRMKNCSTVLSIDDGTSEARSRIANVTLGDYQFLSVTKKIVSDPKYIKAKIIIGQEGSIGVADMNLIEMDAKFKNQNERINANILVEKFSFNKLKLKVEAKGPSDKYCFLYYSDAYHPHWNAYVNGKKTPVIKTNIGYKSVIIPYGTSEVVLKFGNIFHYLSIFCYILLVSGIFGSAIYIFVKEI